MLTTDELEWDLVVDFVCVGAGAGGLAATIAAVDIGATAFVASLGISPDASSDDEATPDSTSKGLNRALGIEFADEETNAYLAALTEDVSHSATAPADSAVPVVPVADFAPVVRAQPGKRDRVPPFYGARLGDWAAACVASAFGVVYSRVVTDTKTPTRLRSGTVVDIAPVGTIELHPDTPALTIEQWLTAVARERGISVYDRSRLQRLVFEDGLVVGAVFDTPTATLAVRARHGVMLACDPVRSDDATSLASAVRQPTTAQVCVVREPLSRFSRIELHVAASAMQPFVGVRGT